MCHSFSATFWDQTLGTEVNVPVQIPANDWTKLEAFANAGQVLAECAPLREGRRARLTIKGSKRGGITFEGTVPSDDDIATILHRIRPIVLQKEPTCFYKVVNLLKRHMTHAGLRKYLDAQKNLFSGKDFQDHVRIDLSTPKIATTLNSEASFNSWINAFEYHRDATKRREIEAMCGLLTFDAARTIFIQLLFDKVKAIFALARFIRQCQSAISAAGRAE